MRLLGDERGQGIHREVGSNHGGGSQQVALGRPQPVEARGEECLQGSRGDHRASSCNAATICSANSGLPRAVSTTRARVSAASAPPADPIGDQLDLGRAERLQEQRVDVAPPRSPRGARLEELGSGQAEEEDRSAYRVCEVLDQVEERGFCPVHVFEDDHERLPPG